jgi:hypothetical protein
MHSGKLTIAWFEHAEPKPAYREESVDGDLLEAVVRAAALSQEPCFLRGRVLGLDDMVLATVAPTGAIRMTTRR